MTELELKFQVSAAARAVVRRALATASARTVRLRARYFDTADRALSRAGIALRLRQEGRRWVQTLKAAGLAGPVAASGSGSRIKAAKAGGSASLLTRLEHEVPLAGSPERPDPSLHAGTDAGHAMRQALGLRDGDAWPPFEPVFETDVRRTLRLVKSRASRVEVAFDEGRILVQQHQVPVCEIEFELKSGCLADLLALADRWVQRHRIWLDVRSKAERGELLAAGRAAAAPAQMMAPRLDSHARAAAGLAAMRAAALAQALPNAAAVCAGTAEPEHLHQLRVGIRRLRSVQKVFGDEAPWQEPLAEVFRRLGGARDLDVLRASVLPAIRASGGPALALPAAGSDHDLGALLRDRPVQRLWLQLIAAADSAPLDGISDQPATGAAAVGALADAPALRPLAAARLRALHKQVMRDAVRLRELDDDARHGLRRRIKRLRYAVEASAALWPAKACRRYLRQLRRMQEALGMYTDLQMAEAWLGEAAPAPAAADPADVDAIARAYARGWLAASRAHALEVAALTLADGAERPAAWRRG